MNDAATTGLDKLMTRWPGNYAAYVEAAVGQDAALDPYIHLYMLNRGILITPFHNTALMSPATTEVDVDRHTAVFADIAAELNP